MSLISIASTFAIVLGLAGTLPHIHAMLQTRSSGGQAPLGWAFGITVNVLTAYVNLAGLGATILGVGNLVAGVLNAAAFALVVRFSMREPARAPVPDVPEPALAATPIVTEPTPVVTPVVAEPVLAAVSQSRPAFHELPTSEFHRIKSLIDEEHARRQTSDVDGGELHDVRPLSVGVELGGLVAA
jgi:hypothetical protein